MAATATAEPTTKFTPVRLWNLEFPNETISTNRVFGKKGEILDETVYQFVDGVFTAHSEEERAAIEAICGSRVAREDIPAPAESLVCHVCGKATRSSRFFKKHLERHP